MIRSDKVFMVRFYLTQHAQLFTRKDSQSLTGFLCAFALRFNSKSPNLRLRLSQLCLLSLGCR